DVVCALRPLGRSAPEGRKGRRSADALRHDDLDLLGRVPGCDVHGPLPLARGSIWLDRRGICIVRVLTCVAAAVSRNFAGRVQKDVDETTPADGNVGFWHRGG